MNRSGRFLIRMALFLVLVGALVAALFLVDMHLAWWEAAGLFCLWLMQFALSPVSPGPGFWGFVARYIHRAVTMAYLAWAAVEIARIVAGKRRAEAFRLFGVMWKRHIRPVR